MIKKIIILLAIVSPFVTYFVYSWLLKLEQKKYPIIKLCIISFFFLIFVLTFLRFNDNFSPKTKYTPPKLENGKLIPAENK